MTNSQRSLDLIPWKVQSTKAAWSINLYSVNWDSSRARESKSEKNLVKVTQVCLRRTGGRDGRLGRLFCFCGRGRNSIWVCILVFLPFQMSKGMRLSGPLTLTLSLWLSLSPYLLTKPLLEHFIPVCSTVQCTTDFCKVLFIWIDDWIWSRYKRVSDEVS